MVGVGSEPYPPPQYYGNCYQHSPQRYGEDLVPYPICSYIDAWLYVICFKISSYLFSEYRGCPCPLNTFPKNVLIGPATGKAPTGGGPAEVPSALAPPGGAFRAKVRACALDTAADTHGSGKVRTKLATFLLSIKIQNS